MQAELEPRKVDEKRRLVMPDDFPPHSAVTLQQVDKDTWIIKRRRIEKGYKVVVIRSVDRLQDDPEFDVLQEKLARHTSKRVPRFQE